MLEAVVETSGSMKKDIYTCSSTVCYTLLLVGVTAFFANVVFPEYGDEVWTVFFFVQGGLCIWNFKRCSRVHCQITGYGFIAVGLLSLLNIMGILTISWNALWLIIAAVLVVGFSVEGIHKGKTGSRYKE